MCYGDTLIDIDLTNTLIFIYLAKKITVASYQLETSFGIFGIENQTQVVDFEEKPALNIWFNVGYFIFNYNNFNLFKKFSKFKELLKFLSKKSDESL